MPEHKTGTREEWQAARDELAKLESEHAQQNEEIKNKRRELPWVRVEKRYEFDTADGTKSLEELFDGRSGGRPASASRRAARVVTPSLGNSWCRWVATVRGDKYSRSPICLLVSPAAASVAICRCWGVSDAGPVSAR